MAAESRRKDAADLGLMQGDPVPAAQRVTRANFMDAPYNRWGLQHIDELLPTRSVPRAGPVANLEPDPRNLDSLAVTLKSGRSLGVDDWLAESFTDGFCVLHDGKLVYETYRNGQTQATRHLMFSVTKSVTATLLLSLVDSGLIETAAPVTRYLPELAGSVYGEATVQQVLDMTVAVVFDENYAARPTEFGAYCAVFGIGFGEPEHGDVHEFLTTLRRRGPHEEGFQYVTPNTEVLGWLIRRATGLPLAQVLQETIWGPLGAESDGYYWLDVAGTEMAGAGLNITLRDAARFGQMILDRGLVNHQQIVPAAVADRILEPGDPTLFNAHEQQAWYEEIGYAYHDQWWTYADPHRLVGGIGIHGQFITIDKVTRTVIVKQSSDPDADSISNETDGPQMMYAISKHLADGTGGNG